MARPKLTVEERKMLGKSVKKLRREGILPANIYGKDIKSLAVQLPQKEFENVFKAAGETGLIDVAVNGEVKPSLIHNVQFDYLRNPLHADFFQVNLKEKVKTMVPIEIIGEPKAEVDKVGLLLQPVSELEVEALPEDLPEHIEINVEGLAAVDDQITIEDIKPPKGVTILTDPSQVVVKIGELVSKEAQEQAAAEEAAAEAAKAEGTAEPAEGAGKAAEGEAEAPKEAAETKTEEKPAEAPKGTAEAAVQEKKN
jgi:large subunit ribosomal protein L25